MYDYTELDRDLANLIESHRTRVRTYRKMAVTPMWDGTCWLDAQEREWLTRNPRQVVEQVREHVLLFTTDPPTEYYSQPGFPGLERAINKWVDQNRTGACK